MISYSVFQHIGARNSQEDRYLCMPVGQGHLFAVLDGHGGALVADEAAIILPRVFQQALESCKSTDLAVKECIRTMIEEMADGRPVDGHCGPSGATLSILYITDSHIYVGVLGDSPVLIKARGQQDYYRSPEHNVTHCPDDVELIKHAHAEDYDRRELMVTDDALVSGFNALQLTRCLGDPEFSRYLIKAPHVDVLPRPSSGCHIVLASDGVAFTSTREGNGVLYEDYLRMLEHGETAHDIGTLVLGDSRSTDNVTVIAINLPTE